MNKKVSIISAGWALSCGAAFLVGRTTSDPAPSESAATDSPTLSGRTVAAGSRANGSGSLSSAGGSATRIRTATPIPQDRLAADVLALTKMTDPIARTESFLALVASLGPDQFLEAIDTYRSQGIDDEQFGEYRILLSSWAKVNPIEALTYAQEKTRGPFARKTILATWAKDDPESAIAWANENFDPGERENRANPWLVGVIEGLASTDANRATQLLEELPYSRGRGEALTSVFNEITRNDTDAGKAWIAGLSDERLKIGAAARLAGKIAENNPRDAAEWASSLGPETMKRSAETIIETWAAKDITAAKTWVASQPEEIAAASGPSLVGQMIEQDDPAGAATWLSQFEGNPAFDDSMRTMAWRSMEQNPETGADFIMKITNERDQERTFHRVLRNWMRNDREGAQEYIENNPVPASIKRRAGQDAGQ